MRINTMGPLSFGAVLAALATLSAAHGQSTIPWSENFDSYAPGSGLAGQGGWEAWDNSSAADSKVSDLQSRSPSNSVDIKAASDSVMQFTNADSGCLEFIAHQFVPGNTTGTSYFILLSEYDHNSTTNVWAVQIQFNAGTDSVVADFDSETLPLIYDRWVEIKVVVNLDDDLHSVYYDGQPLFEDKSWTEAMNGGNSLRIDALDLYANNATSVFYDDLSLRQIEGCGDPPADFELVVGGSCPGTVTFEWNGATPNRTLGLLYAASEGTQRIPDGQPCAGTQLRLSRDQLQLVTQFPSGPDGSGLRAGRCAQRGLRRLPATHRGARLRDEQHRAGRLIRPRLEA